MYPGPDGKLVYKALSTSDRIMDFSHAGYMGGGTNFDEAVTRFASAYADQNERDFEAFEEAVRSGRLQAEKELL